MNRLGTAAITGVIATLLAGPFASVARPAPAPTLVTLRNGLRVVLAPDSAATAVDLAVWYPVGISAEAPEALGERHLVERLMFRGSANVPDGDFVRRITAEGGAPNTQLTLDHSCFYETLPAEALGLALSMEADRMAGLRPSPQAFEECRRASDAEVRARAARPVVTRALARLGETVYDGTPYERAPEGDAAALARLTPAGVEAWRRAHYGPSGALLTVVGRFDPQATLALVRRLFEPLPAGRAPEARGAKAPAATARGRRVWERAAGVPARLLLVGWRVPGMGDRDAAAVELLAAVLGSIDSTGFTATMTQRFASASFAQCGLDRHRDASMLWTVVALAPGADSAATELQVTDFVGSLKREAVARVDLDRVRARFVTAELLRAQAVRARAQSIGEAVIEGGDLASADRRLAAMQALGPDDLQRVAQRVLADEACSIVWMVPAGGRR